VGIGQMISAGEIRRLVAVHASALAGETKLGRESGRVFHHRPRHRCVENLGLKIPPRLVAAVLADVTEEINITVAALGQSCAPIAARMPLDPGAVFARRLRAHSVLVDSVLAGCEAKDVPGRSGVLPGDFAEPEIVVPTRV